MKPIAILSSNHILTMNWINNGGIGKINFITHHTKLINTSDGRNFVIIHNIHDILGWNFSGVIKAPDYKSLEDEVNARIR